MDVSLPSIAKKNNKTSAKRLAAATNSMDFSLSSSGKRKRHSAARADPITNFTKISRSTSKKTAPKQKQKEKRDQPTALFQPATFQPPLAPVGELTASLLTSLASEPHGLGSGIKSRVSFRALDKEKKDNMFGALGEESESDEEEEAGPNGEVRGSRALKRRKSAGSRTYFAAPTFQAFGTLVAQKASSSVGELALQPATFQVKKDEKEKPKEQKKVLSAEDWKEL